MVTPPKGGKEVEEKNDGGERGLRDDQHSSPEFYTDRWGSDGNRWLSISYYYIFFNCTNFLTPVQEGTLDPFPIQL